MNFEFMAPDGERGEQAMELFRQWKREKQDTLIKQIVENGRAEESQREDRSRDSQREKEERSRERIREREDRSRENRREKEESRRERTREREERSRESQREKEESRESQREKEESSRERTREREERSRESQREKEESNRERTREREGRSKDSHSDRESRNRERQKEKNGKHVAGLMHSERSPSPERKRPRLDDRIKEMLAPSPVTPVKTPPRRVVISNDLDISDVSDNEIQLLDPADEPNSSSSDSDSSSESESSSSGEEEEEKRKNVRKDKKEVKKSSKRLSEGKKDKLIHMPEEEGEKITQMTVITETIFETERGDAPSNNKDEEGIMNKEVRKVKEAASSRVLLNIGGQKFDTSRATLTTDPSSLFALVIQEEGSQEYLFFDRDPAHFRLILNFMRNGCTCDLRTLPHDARYLYELYYEAKYYRLKGLMKACIRKIEERSVVPAGLDEPF